MSYELDMNKLATMVRYQRAHRPFRQIAAELGDVSASTLNRLEAGRCPDLVVFLRVCSWLKTEPNQFIRVSAKKDTSVSSSQPASSQGQIIHLIQSDAALSPVTANVLTALVNAAYQITD